MVSSTNLLLFSSLFHTEMCLCGFAYLFVLLLRCVDFALFSSHSESIMMANFMVDIYMSFFIFPYMNFVFRVHYLYFCSRKKENMAGRYNQNLIFPKAILTVASELCRWVCHRHTHTHIPQANRNEKKWHSPNANQMEIMQTKFTWITIKCEKCEKHIFT